MNIYQKTLDELKQASRQLSISDRRISAARLFAMLSIGVLIYQTANYIYYVPIAILLVAFFLLIKRHQSIRWQKKLNESKIAVNQRELNFLSGHDFPFESGEEFIQSDHSYSYDLDFFGERSIFQLLNRTGTVRGKEMLAAGLLKILPKNEIINTQDAIKELAPQLEWRQHFLALGSIDRETKENYEDIIEWSNRKPFKENKLLMFLSFLLPAATWVCLILSFVVADGIYGNMTLLLFLANLGMLATKTQTIKDELITSTKVEVILKHYSLLLGLIENQPFNASKLHALQKELIMQQKKASTAIHHLSLLFGRMEHVVNIFASPLLNGFLQYHIHILRGFSKWRLSYGSHIKEWLDAIGEFEKLNSLANFSYNNPEFVFPAINTDYQIQFEHVGHPLLTKEKAITNSINFDKHRFFILTGSNMSGKSTFLRTVGVNMVLAGIGAPVFASQANVHPLPVLVTMRLSDSLTDSESYFYAEVKRLKYIMDQLDQQPSFVLLDEILRGTNSDDKREGTLEVIKKMAQRQAFGGIATHDLEVCKVTEEFPDVLNNKRFEVEIVNDELVFDYQLRDGVCENKSASFIMKKMGVI